MAKTDEVVSAKMIPVVQGIVDWIEAHIFDTLSVSAIAKKSGYSHWYFQRLVPRIPGTEKYSVSTPASALNRLSQSSSFVG